MRLAILDSGQSFTTKALFAFIHVVSRQPVLDVIKLVKCRADFYGRIESSPKAGKNPANVIKRGAPKQNVRWTVWHRTMTSSRALLSARPLHSVVFRSGCRAILAKDTFLGTLIASRSP
jgi:hypothetical protein